MGPIGIFDSGYGGLTVFKEIERSLPAYDYIYLGDNARVPYGNRSASAVYEFTRECVGTLFGMGCRLVILACNTASATALRTIQQEDLPTQHELHRVLGVLRPTTELVGRLSHTGAIGVMATAGTVASGSYPREFSNFHPALQVYQQACPMLVPLIEAGDLNSPAAHYYARYYTEALLKQSDRIDLVLMACTHYPLLAPLLREYLPDSVKLLGQGELVAESLRDYLNRHPEVEAVCSKTASREFYTTDDPSEFSEKAALFYGKSVQAKKLSTVTGNAFWFKSGTHR